MRKYDAQRKESRGLTVELCLVLGLAVVGTIALSAVAMAAIINGAAYEYVSAMTTFKMSADYWRGIFYDRLLQCGVLTLLAVVGTAVVRSWQLAEGGGRDLAPALGGTRLTDPAGDADLLKVLNVVEELAIAAGIRPPPVFILKDEPGINAFAAGFDPKDAVIGVTQGAIDRLQRQQLQGIIAHEFSHITNGDMRLNIQLLGVLTGVQAIALAARFLLRLGLPLDKKDVTGKNPLGMVLALVFGAALWPIGQIGSLFAMMIHLAVSRQREFLADASAVELTRDPHGLLEALAILLDDKTSSRMVGPSAQLASHMLFAGSGSAWQRLFETHPPLEERIRRLDPLVTSTSAASPSLANAPHA